MKYEYLRHCAEVDAVGSDLTALSEQGYEPVLTRYVDRQDRHWYEVLLRREVVPAPLSDDVVALRAELAELAELRKVLGACKAWQALVEKLEPETCGPPRDVMGRHASGTWFKEQLALILVAVEDGRAPLPR